MRVEETALARLIDSVADGTPIDWQQVDGRALDDRERRLLSHLRLVANVAEVHRTLVADPPTGAPEIPDAPSALPHAPDAVEGAASWGHLLLNEKVGEGAYGEVYRARDPWLDREVALKLLKPVPGHDALLRILHEARTLARVRHPNVVTVHGADVHGGRVGLWMEFVPGRTLEDRLASEGPLSGGEGAVIGQELCRALGAVHAAGLLHRDVKARNVIRETGGRVVLMDFGAGQGLEIRRDTDWRPAGTPVYLAPELIEGRGASARTDIYALGVLLFHLVTGTYPVRGGSFDDLRRAHRQGERLRLRDLRSDLPDTFVNAVERAIDADPSRRFASAGEMQEALGGAPAAAPPVAPAGPDTWSRRRALIGAAALVAAAIAAMLWWQRPSIPGFGAGRRTIAVLPLRTAGVEPYFADGVTEALIQELSRVGSFRVISRTSAMRFKDSTESIPAIAETLDADAVVEGSVLLAGSDIRVNLRLIDALRDTPVWSRSFQRPVAAASTLHHDIARAIAEDLRVVVTPETAARWAQPRKVSQASYDAYLRGRQAFNEQTIEALHRALAHFAEAVRLDPSNGAAHSAAALVHANLADRGTHFDKASSDARRAAGAALGLEPDLAEAHAVLAYLSFLDWKWDEAETGFRRALSLNPSQEYARERYAMFLAARGRLDEALAQNEEARKLDPLSLGMKSAAGALLRYARRYDDALAQYRAVLNESPQHLGATVGLGRTFNAMARHDEAVGVYRQLHARQPDDVFVAGELAQAYAGLGRRTDAETLLQRLERELSDPARRDQAGQPAYVHARLGNRDRAFGWLENAVNRRSRDILWLGVDPRVDSLRIDPRFDALLARLQLRKP